MTTSEAFIAHIHRLEELALAGDEDATRSLCAIVLAQRGWRVGDPDPSDGDDVNSS